MCRFTIYKGNPILLGDLVIQPENSLLKQSRDAAYHPGVVDHCHKRNILVNGDGFGVAWYGQDLSKGSCCFKFVTPAWSNRNLRNIGEHISSSMMFAHVRAASSGHDPHEKVAVNSENCHPFKHERLTFMHNGGVPHFSRIKRKLLNLLSEPVFQGIEGSTDSEHIFALFIEYYTPYKNFPPHANYLVDAMNKTISMVISLCAEVGIREKCSLNLVVTDGINIVATRFRNGRQNPPSLYYNLGSNFVCENGRYYPKDCSVQAADCVTISSAPLSMVSSYGRPYHEDLEETEHEEKNGPCSDDEDELKDGNFYPPPNVEPGPDFRLEDHDIGSWVLVPKNHMIICYGAQGNHHLVGGLESQPVVIFPRSELSTSVAFDSVLTTVATTVLEGEFEEGVDDDIEESSGLKSGRLSPESDASNTTGEDVKIQKNSEMKKIRSTGSEGCLSKPLSEFIEKKVRPKMMRYRSRL